MNIYFCITKDSYEDATGASSFPCELVVASSVAKAKYLAHKANKMYLDYSFEYIDWHASLVVKNVEYEAGILPADSPAWEDYFCEACGNPLRRCQCQKQQMRQEKTRLLQAMAK